MTTTHTTFETHAERTRAHLWSLRRVLPTVGPDGLAFFGFAALCAIPLVIGVSSALAGERWYAALDTPSFAPPAWSFGVASTLTAAALAWSTWSVWRAEDACDHERHSALGAFGALLVLSALWAPVFFVGHASDLGLLVLAVHWLCALGAICTYASVRSWAGIVNVPQLLWVSYLVVVQAAVLLRA